MRRFVSFLALIVVLGSTSGCAPRIARWVVQTRDRQGDLAYERRDYPGASIAYQLALRVDPADVHARDGVAAVQVRLAAQAFIDAKFDDALAALQIATKWAPGDDRITILRQQVEQAQLKREIVVSNYPAYAESGLALRRSYEQAARGARDVAATLRKFSYTYDVNQLAAAMVQSDEVEVELERARHRLTQYRQLVEVGSPSRAAAPTLGAPTSLLPLP